MLVLERRLDEVITIGDDIRITVVRIRDEKVRLGITAPRDVQVHREEVRDAIRAGHLTDEQRRVAREA